MANNYSAVYLQIVFAVKYREALLHKSWRSNLFAYASHVLTERGHFALAVNGYEDHIHLFIDYSTKEMISDLVREIKKSMSNFIKYNELCTTKFRWQSGYGVFSHGTREKGRIIEYIRNQEEHHQWRNFRKEYYMLLDNYEIEYKDEYVFEFFE